MKMWRGFFWSHAKLKCGLSTLGSKTKTIQNRVTTLVEQILDPSGLHEALGPKVRQYKVVLMWHHHPAKFLAVSIQENTLPSY